MKTGMSLRSICNFAYLLENKYLLYPYMPCPFCAPFSSPCFAPCFWLPPNNRFSLPSGGVASAHTGAGAVQLAKENDQQIIVTAHNPGLLEFE